MDEKAIVAVALDYFEGWYDADVDRVDRALHPELVKRWVGENHGEPLNPTLTKDRMLDLVREGRGAKNKTDDPIEVVVADIHRDVATAVVRSAEYREYVHLVRTSSGWKIVNTLWQFTKPR